MIKMNPSRFLKETSKEYAQDVLRHRGIYCSSRERIKWCKKYLNRLYRRVYSKKACKEDN